MPKRRYAFLILVLTFATVAFGVGAFARFLILSGCSHETDERVMSASAQNPAAYAVEPGGSQGTGDSTSQDQEQLFTEVHDKLRTTYVHQITDDRALALAAVRNMLAELDDPNAVLIPTEDAGDFLDQQNGRYHGIGAGLAVREFTDPVTGEKDRKLVIVSPIAGGPAQKAGLQPGDVVEKVNDKTVLSLKGLYKLIKTEQRLEELTHSVDPATLPLVLERLQERGELRTKDKMSVEEARRILISSQSKIVDLAVRREGLADPLSFEIKCLAFKPTGVSHRVDGTHGVLAIPSLGDGAYGAVRAALEEMAGSGVTDLVLDLRNNPGGSFDEAVGIARLFTEGGPLAQIQCRGGQRRPLTPQGEIQKVGSFHVVVLCNRGTAGAAEFLAGALVDEAGARLAGSQSFGDADWLKVMKLDDGSLVQFSSGRLLTPGGTEYLGLGLAPQRAIAGADSNEPQARARVIEEALKLF